MDVPIEQGWIVQRHNVTRLTRRGRSTSSSAPEGHGKDDRHRGREDRPRWQRGGAHRVSECQCRDHGDRDPPVVAHDKVVPKSQERLQPGCHDGLSSATFELTGRLPALRRAATRVMANSATAGTKTSSAASPAGHRAPAPSAPQKIPNEVSMTATMNFIAFSGTRVSGARRVIPATATTSTADSAAKAASGTLR